MTDDKAAKVTVYGAEWCPPCHVVKHYLDGRKVAYDYINIDQQPEAGMAIVQKTGWRSIPIIQIGDDYILGFDRERIDEALRHNQLS